MPPDPKMRIPPMAAMKHRERGEPRTSKVELALVSCFRKAGDRSTAVRPGASAARSSKLVQELTAYLHLSNLEPNSTC